MGRPEHIDSCGKLYTSKEPYVFTGYDRVSCPEGQFLDAGIGWGRNRDGNSKENEGSDEAAAFGKACAHIGQQAQAAGLPCIVSDSVTEEVKILKSTRRLPLRAGADAWGREIEKALDVKRRDTYQEMRDAGFDIETLTQELTEFYEQAGR